MSTPPVGTPPVGTALVPPPPWPPAPPVAPRPPRPAASLAVAVRAAGVGLLAALLVPGHRPGAGLVVAGAAVAVAVSPRPRTPYALVLSTVCAGLVAVAAVRDARWVVLMCLAAAVAGWSLLLSDGDGWRGTARGVLAVPRGWVPAVPWVARPLVAAVGAGSRVSAPVVRGAAVAGLLLVVFGGLFVTADAAFRELLGTLRLPAPRPGLLVHVLVLLAAAGLVGAGARALADRRPAPPVEPPARRSLRLVEWVLPLVVLDLLFAAFVAVQLTVLFGGRDHVLETAGLTYAQYARQGFAQLVATAVLTLGVVAVTARVVPRDPRTDLLRRALLGVLCLLTLVVLASASRRLGLYEQQYGFTRLRLSVDAAIGWLAVVLVLVLAAGARSRAAWLPRAVVLSAAAGLLAFAAADPDGRIAAHDVERWASTGDVDTAYLATLSADAVPALLDLPPTVRPCLAARADPLAGWNASRHRARLLLGGTRCPSRLR